VRQGLRRGENMKEQGETETETETDPLLEIQPEGQSMQ
jgi:hypothetical protein